jgi:Flp pilus assembly pilin Flp
LNFIVDDNGQTVLEYALIIAVLVLVVMATMPSFRNQVRDVFLGTKNRLVVPAN